jgi:branched-chain amino acid transport system substrate-binding protein
MLGLSGIRRCLAFAGFLLLLLFGCGGPPAPSGGQSGEKTLTIGAIMPLTGAAAQYGQNCKNGIELAVKENNQANPRLKLKIILEDDRTEPKDAVSAFTKLVAIDKVPLVIGPLPSSCAMAAAPLANEDKVVLFSPGASTPKLTAAGPFVFRNWQSDAYEAKIMARYLVNQGKKQIAILAVNNDFGIALRNFFRQEFQSLGGRITATESFQQDATDFRTQLAKIKASKPEGLYLLSYPKESGNIVNQATQLGVKVAIYGVAAMEDPSLVKTAGRNADGIVYTKAVEPASDDPTYRHFVQAYKAEFGSEPGLIADTGYDAVRMVMQACESLRVFNGESLAKALGGIKNFPGASGLMSFDENGDIIKPVGIKRILKGQFVWIDRSPSR